MLIDSGPPLGLRDTLATGWWEGGRVIGGCQLFVFTYLCKLPHDVVPVGRMVIPHSLYEKHTEI